MAQTRKNNLEDLDFFDFIEIIFKKKYTIFIFIILSISFGYLYVSKIRSRISHEYLIQTTIVAPSHDSIQSTDCDDRIKSFALAEYIEGWFRDGIYKGSLEELSELSNLPDIQTKRLNKPGVLQLNMKYNDREEGKKILIHICKKMQISEYLNNILKNQKELIHREIKRENNVLGILEKQNNRLKERTLIIEKRIKENVKSVSELQSRLMELKKNTKNLLKNADETSIQLYHNYSEILNWNINNLKGRQEFSRLNSLIYNEFLRKLKKEISMKEIEIEKFNAMVKKLHPVFEYVGPVFGEIIPLKRLSNKKIIGLFTMIGLFIGISIALLLGVRERHIVPN